ncbi:GNAT family N-acetyltransferase [Halobacillus sp. A5]|uniref:GNAT family N-acetyltransferase n=1 Tax=Halobacillus sp. A5 TaxID=2880263 RepID=UPI0020A67434|nr:GNAT family N-acetyltransferase [Halobacillus sp. A5]MCP3029452.1 GNAT family N-acetyltransferase [Halobacillus sp. A5]
MSFLLSNDHARMVENAEINTLKNRLERIKEIVGNPMEVDINKFGHAVAFTVKNVPGPTFNMVKGMTELEINLLDSIIDFYNAKGIPARFEVTPAQASKELFRNLSVKGFYQSGFHTSLYGTLPPHKHRLKEPSGIKIEKMNIENFDAFGEIYTKGFNMPVSVKNHVTKNNRVLLNNEHWNFYLASVEGKPAGVGVLFCENGIGTLAASATLPEFRNKGVHTALIKERIEKANELNCHLIVGQSAFGSVSQRNMEKAGLKIAYTHAVWEEL